MEPSFSEPYSEIKETSQLQTHLSTQERRRALRCTPPEPWGNSSREREVGRRSGRRVPLRPAAGLRLSAQWGGADTPRASAHRACSRRSAGPCVGLSGDSAGRMTVCAAQGGGRLRSAPQTHVNVDRSQPREDRKGGREAWEGGRPRGRGSSKAGGERTSETAEFRDGL